MRSLRSFRALSPLRRRLVIRSGFVVAYVRIALTVLPFARVRAVLRRVASRRGGATIESGFSADELAWAVGVVSGRVPRATCLVRALALELLLTRSGRDAELRVGVAKENGRLMAHAWVESDGRRLLEDSEPTRFAPLPSGW